MKFSSFNCGFLGSGHRLKDIVIKIFWEMRIRLGKISLEMDRALIDRNDAVILVPIAKGRKKANRGKTLLVYFLSFGMFFSYG